MCLSSGAFLRCHYSPASLCNCKARGSFDSASACKALPLHYASSAALPPVAEDVAHPLWRLGLALSFSSIAIFDPFHTALAETVKPPNDKIFPFSHSSQRPPFVGGSIEAEISPDLSAPCLQAPNNVTAEEVFDAAQKAYGPGREDVFLAERGRYPLKQSSSMAEEGFDDFQAFESDRNVHLAHAQALLRVSSSIAEQSTVFLDFAGVLSPARAHFLLSDIRTLEAEAGWRLRVITKSGSSSSLSGKDLKDLWKPDEKTVIVIEDLSSRNILNFNAGAEVLVKLPRQFFLELQSRYGNQFYVQQEGEGEALTSTVKAIRECLSRPEGCKNVPGLTNDLYYLTLITSIVGGCVFGFAARLRPSGRVEASWQWVVILSPLWLLLFVSFGVLPVVTRTSDLEPLLKNILGFCAGAVALCLTPIFGASPISKR